MYNSLPGVVSCSPGLGPSSRAARCSAAAQELVKSRASDPISFQEPKALLVAKTPLSYRATPSSVLLETVVWKLLKTRLNFFSVS